MPKGYISNRQKNLKIGISSYTESNTVLEVTGKVGIGTTNASTTLDVNGGIRIRGALYDKDNQAGNPNQVLSSTGSGVDWVNAASADAITGLTIRDEGNVVGSANNVSELNFVGNIVSVASTLGIATITFSNYVDNAGIATYATTAGVATALQNARTFEITGDIVASPISFDGTGNVSLAATIQPNSVALGGDTTGDYVQSISGTSNQITVTGGTGEGSTPTLSIPNQFTIPQDATVTRDLQVNRNLNVTGNITIGGTSATIFSQTLTIFDPDIVLGFRTDGSGNDVSTDNTANHGGIAIASTEGTPLISLYDVGVGETNPATYKKFMWFKSGTFSGLGTDAWLSNYAIGIGSTQVPNGVRLAAGGVQFTENDLSAVRNINASGIITSTGLTVNGNVSINNGTGNVLNLNNGTITGVHNIEISDPGPNEGIQWLNGNGWRIYEAPDTLANTGGNLQFNLGSGRLFTMRTDGSLSVPGIVTATGLQITSGITTLGITTFTGAVSFGTSAYFGDNDTLNFGDGNDLRIYHDGSNSFVEDSGTGNLYLQSNAAGIILQKTSGNENLARFLTDGAVELYYDNSKEFETTGYGATVFGTLQSQGLFSSGISTISVNSSTDALTITQLGSGNALVVEDSTNPDSSPFVVNASGSVGIGTTNPASKLQVDGNVLVSGISTFIGNGTAAGPAIFAQRDSGNNAGIKLYGTSGGNWVYSESTSSNPKSLIFDSSQSENILFRIAGGTKALIQPTGEVLIGSATSTGTASQLLQVNSGGYFNGLVGIGTTNPTYKTHILDTGAIGAGLLVQGGGAGSDIAKFQRTVNGVGYLSVNCSSSTPQLQFGASSHTISLGLSDSLGGFEIADNTVLGTNTRFFVARSTGNTGIGTTNPKGARLDVQGPVAIGTGTDYDNLYSSLLIRQRPANDGYASLGFYPANGNFVAKIDAVNSTNELQVWSNKNSSDGSRLNINMGASEYISFSPRSVEAARIIQGGTVLIGAATSTATASQRLQVTGGAYVSGDVGIGITNPQRKLHLRASGPDGVFLDNSDQTGNSGGPLLRVRGQRIDGNVSQSFSGQLVLEKWRMDASVQSGQNLGAIIFGGNFTTTPTATTGITYAASISAVAEGTFSNINTAPTAIVFNTGTVGLGTLTLPNLTYGTEAARITSNRNLLIGATSETGTSSQPLQVTGGAYVSTRLGVGVTNPASNTQVAIAGTLGISEVGGAGTRTLLSSTSAGFVLNHSDNSNIDFRVLNGTKLQYQYSPNFWTIPAGVPFLVGTASSTGTANQLLRVEGGAYVSGNLGAGVTNPASRIDAYNSSPGSTVIRASSGSYANLSSGVIIGIATNAASSSSSQFSASGAGVTSGEIGAYSFYPTFANFPSDRTPRRAVDLVGGFATGTWGTEYFAINVGKDGSPNDSQTLTNERLRIDGSGRVGIGTTNPTSTLHVFGNGNFTGVVTASSFSGNASSATYATNAGISTNLKGGLVGNIPYQSATDTTVFLENGTSGFVLQSNGVGNAPSWVAAASANAITGLTIQEEGSQVGTANAVNTLNFIGSNITATASGGISTITVSDNLVGTGLSISGISTFTNGPVLIGSSSSTGTLSQTLQVTGGAYISGNIGIKTTNPQSALDVRGTISIGRTDVAGINSIFSVIDINSWEYGGVFKSISAEDATPQDIYFKDDGTKMYTLGDSGNEVNEYALSTAWDVSTAGFTTVFSTASQETNPLGLYFKPDGTRMYICGSTAISPASADQVRSYTLSTPWSIASGSITYDNKAYTTTNTAPQGVYFKDDGLKMYVVDSTFDGVYEYSLSTAWELDSTITLLNSVPLGTANTLNLPLSLTAPTGIDFNASGTKMYIIDQTRDVVARFDLATPWDTTTISFYDNVYIGFQELTPTGIFYQEDQSKAYIVGTSNDTVYQFNTDVPSLELASSGISTRSSIILNNEARLNNRLYVTGDTHFSSNSTIKGSLTVDNSITVGNDIVISDDLTVSGGTITAGNVATVLLGGNTTTGINLADAQTSGSFILGGTSQTGTITLGRATTSQITDIQAAATTSGNTKTINLGTGGLSGSRTIITVGSATAGAASTVTIPSPTNFIIGSATSTGTANQPLQVTGGAYVSDNLGINSTSPTQKLDVVGNIKLTGELQGPSNFIIDPAAVGDDTGSVRIKGDLYVDGTQFVVNSTTIELADFNVGIATTVGINTDLNGAGIGIGSTNIRKTITWENSSSSLRSSENWKLPDNKSLILGDGNDLQIYHDGSQSTILDQGTGQLRIGAENTFYVGNSAFTEAYIKALYNGQVELYYDNVKEFETTGYGATVYGTLQSQGLQVSGITTSPTYDTVSTRTGSATATTTTTSQTAIHTGLPSASYRSVEYLVQAVQSTNFHTTKILVVHDGTTAYLTEYGTVFNNATVASYDVDISGGNIRLLATPASSSSTTFKISFTTIAV